eukprot:Nk52_evm19s2568 gene=Nk52_evmTU19s2568
MGSVFSSSIDRNREEMLEMQRQMILKQRETQMAIELARAKDHLEWTKYFSYSVLIFCATAFAKTKRVMILTPLLPLSFANAYQYDLVYGDKLDRVRRDAEMFIREQPERFLLPDNSKLISRQEYLDLFQIHPDADPNHKK